MKLKAKRSTLVSIPSMFVLVFCFLESSLEAEEGAESFTAEKSRFTFRIFTNLAIPFTIRIKNSVALKLTSQSPNCRTTLAQHHMGAFVIRFTNLYKLDKMSYEATNIMGVKIKTSQGNTSYNQEHL